MRFDYVIIGAGVIGGATAYHLQRRNPDARILLVDQGKRPGTGNTAKSAALYRNIFSSPTSFDLAASSISYYETLGDAIQLDPIGYLWLFSEKQWKRSTSLRERLDPDRDRLELLDEEDIDGILRVNLIGSGPFPDISKGIFGHRCGSLSGMALAEHYVSEFLKMGGEIRLGTKISGFGLTGAGSIYAPWDNVETTSARTSEGEEIRADHFISAVGAWTHDLLAPLGIAPNVLPKKRQLFGLKVDKQGLFPGDGISDPGIEQRGPAIILPAGGVYLKPVRGRDFLMVGCADTLGQPFTMEDKEPDESYFRKAIQPVLEHYFPELGSFRLTTKWAGYYAYHWPDKNPVVETVSNMTWASGTSGSGIMKADAIGRITASHVMGNRTAVLADGQNFNVSRLTLRKRDVETEGFII